VGCSPAAAAAAGGLQHLPHIGSHAEVIMGTEDQDAAAAAAGGQGGGVRTPHSAVSAGAAAIHGMQQQALGVGGPGFAARPSNSTPGLLHTSGGLGAEGSTRGAAAAGMHDLPHSLTPGVVYGTEDQAAAGFVPPAAGGALTGGLAALAAAAAAAEVAGHDQPTPAQHRNAAAIIAEQRAQRQQQQQQPAPRGQRQGMSDLQWQAQG